MADSQPPAPHSSPQQQPQPPPPPTQHPPPLLHKLHHWHSHPHPLSHALPPRPEETLVDGLPMRKRSSGPLPNRCAAANIGGGSEVPASATIELPSAESLIRPRLLLRPTSLPSSPRLLGQSSQYSPVTISSGSLHDSGSGLLSPSSQLSSFSPLSISSSSIASSLHSSHSDISQSLTSPRRTSGESAASLLSSRAGHHPHSSIIGGAWNISPDSTHVSTPVPVEPTNTRESSEEQEAGQRVADERRKSDIAADLSNALRNPCHQLLAYVDLLDNSPTLSGLFEEREMLRVIRLSAHAIKIAVSGPTNEPEKEAAASQQTTPALSSNLTPPMSRPTSSSGPISGVTSSTASTPPVSASTNTTPSHKSASAYISPALQLRVQSGQPSAPPSAPISTRTVNPNAGLGLERNARTPQVSHGNTGGFASRTTGKFDVSGLNILIVDDMQLNRKVLRKMLEGILAVDTACDGLEAVQFVRTKLEASLKMKLPPIPNLEQMMLQNATSQQQQSTNDQPVTPAPATPLPGTPTNAGASTPTTPVMMLASPEVASIVASIGHGSHTPSTPAASGESTASIPPILMPTRGTSLVTLSNVDLPSAEERVERHHSFPTTTMLPSSQGVQISQQHHWPGGLSQPPLHHSATLDFSLGLGSPSSPQTPLIMPATPLTQSPSSSRRHSAPIQPKMLNFAQMLPNSPTSKAQYDCIITDLSMPKLSGLQEAQLVRQFEQDLALPPVPIIAVSSNTTTADRIACAQVGISYFLPKPFCKRDIIALLELIAHERTLQHHSLAGLRHATTTPPGQAIPAHAHVLSSPIAPGSLTNTPTYAYAQESTHVAPMVRARSGSLPFTLLPAAALGSPHGPRERQISISDAIATCSTTTSTLASSPPSGDSTISTISTTSCESTESHSSGSASVASLDSEVARYALTSPMPSGRAGASSRASGATSQAHALFTNLASATMSPYSVAEESGSARSTEDDTVTPASIASDRDQRVLRPSSMQPPINWPHVDEQVHATISHLR